MTEDELIARWFAGRGPARADVVLGVGDDAALLRVPAGMELVSAVDALVAGVHFFPDAAPEDVGHRVLAVNLSDLAAMGATPAWALLTLVLPDADESWLAGFSAGLFELAARHDVALVGGDTNRGPLCVCLHLHGHVPAGAALRRDGARPGDDVWVSGTLGDAAAGLELVRDGAPGRDAAAAAQVRARFLRPQPRVAEGATLRGIASAVIDVSDGLVRDAGRLARASGAGIEIDAGSLPLSDALRALHDDTHARWLALGGGDDYELLFAVPPARRAELERAARAWPVPCTRIGRVVAGAAVRVQLDGADLQVGTPGFSHF
jgi:thiamine-monophosphate kinase